ncbi:MAG: hypothetical protein ABII12_15445 [Planctomycetota bacterium]
MATLRVFCDESGNLPTADSELPFLACAIATLGIMPDMNRVRKNPQDLATSLKARNSGVGMAYVVPSNGFSNALATKLNKLDTMIRMARLLDAAPGVYPTRNPRNHIWVQCMSQAIGQAIVQALPQGTIDSMEIVLDQKTLPSRMTAEIDDLARSLPDEVSASLSRAREDLPRSAAFVAGLFRLRRDAVTLRWSDEPGVDDNSNGLRVAHCLANYGRRTVRGRLAVPINELLTQAGIGCSFIDVTAKVIGDLPEDFVEDWKARTGLPEPGA